MMTGLSTISLILGTTVAYFANNYPEHRVVLETVGGILFNSRIGLDGLRFGSHSGTPLGGICGRTFRNAVPVAATCANYPQTARYLLKLVLKRNGNRLERIQSQQAESLPARSGVLCVSGMTAQYAAPIAILVTEVAAAERCRRAVIKLVVGSTMIGAIGSSGDVLLGDASLATSPGDAKTAPARIATSQPS
jgi:hypothetical protein